MPLRRSIPLILATVLAGCGGGGSHTLPQAVSSPSGPAPAAKTVAGFTITVPAANAQAHARNPQYISTATQSMIITLVSVNGAPFTGAQAETAANLNSSNAACSGSPLTCTVYAPAQAGTDVFTVSTYSAQQTSSAPAMPAGSLLSTASVSVTVVAGQTNTPPTPLVLNGVAASISATLPNDQHITGSETAGYAIAGRQLYTLTVSAQDSSGATIVGDGAPSFTVSSANGAVTVVPASANTFEVQVKSFSATPVNLTITPSTGTSATVGVTTVQELWVAEANQGRVEAFALTSPPTPLPADVITSLDAPTDIAIDSNGLLWIVNYGTGIVYAFIPGSNTAIAADTITGMDATSARFDSNGNLWVADFTTNAIYAYAPGAPPSRITADTITGLTAPEALAIDASNHVWVSEYFANIIEAFTPGNSTPIAGDTVTNGVENSLGLAFDSGGDLWVTNSSATTVTSYRPGTNVPLSILTNGLTNPVGIAFDATGRVWVGNGLAVTPYGPGLNVPMSADTIATTGSAFAVAIAP